MVIGSTPAEALSTRRQTRPNSPYVTDFIGRWDDPAPVPTVHLVQAPPEYVIAPHFHGVSQYQVVVGGSGLLGKKKLQVGVAQYVDPFTPYGPIVAGREGLEFFTLRQTSYPGFHTMPGSKDQMKGKAGRNFVVSTEVGRTKTTAARVLHQLEDGVAAVQLTARPGDLLPAYDLDSGGAHYLVMSGEVSFEGHAYPERSCLWVGPDDRRPMMTAGKDGAVVLLLSYPKTPLAP